MDYLARGRQYVRLGFGVIPIRVNGTKAPAIASWQPYRERLATEDELQQWFVNGTLNGLAVVCGAVSRNLLVLDFDVDAEVYFEQWWNEAMRQVPGITNKILVVQTPRPGRQVWLRQQSEPAGNQVLAYTAPLPTGEDDADGQPIAKPKVLIETRGTGGYAIAVGSPPAVHPTGRPYELIHGSFDRLPQIDDGDVQALLDICRGFNQYTPQHVQRRSAEPYAGEPRPGDIFNQHSDIRDLLVRHGWAIHHQDSDGVEYWTRPGKTAADGWSASLGYITDGNGRPVLYVFSTSAAPLEHNHAYDAFALFALLEHNGDFSAAAAAARSIYSSQLELAHSQYFGSPGQAANPTSFMAYRAFPLSSLPPLLADYVRLMAGGLLVDSAMIAVQVLPTLAALIGQSRQIRLRDHWTQPSVLWALAIVPSGTGKSAAHEYSIRAATEVEARLTRSNKLLRAEYERELQAYKDDRSLPKPDKPFFPQLLVTNFTMEALLRRLSANWKGLFLVRDELSGWLASFNQYRGGRGDDKETMLTLWNGRIEAVDRTANDFHIDCGSCALSITGTTQNEVARKVLLADDVTENGLAARLLICQPECAFVCDDGRDRIPQVCQTLEHFIRLGARLFELTGDVATSGDIRPTILSLEDDARGQFFAWKNEVHELAYSLPEGPLCYARSKLDSQTARIALVFSVVRQLVPTLGSSCFDATAAARGPVTAEDMASAIAVARWFWREAERFYGQLTETESHRLQRKVVAWMRRSRREQVTPSEVLTFVNGIDTVAQAEAVLANMVSSGLGQMVPTAPGTPGRPTVRFQLFT